MAMFTSNPPVAKFARIGDIVEGTIVDVYRSQRYEYVRGGQGLPLYWSNKKPTPGARINPETGQANDPVLQHVITVDTGTPDDNGDTERRIFVKNKRMETALTAAVTLAGGRRVGGLLIGGYLRCTWTGEEQGDGPSPAKVHSFEYAAPPAGTGREPSGEVRLAEREPEPTVPSLGGGSVPAMGIAREQPGDSVPAYRGFIGHGAADAVTFNDRLAVGDPVSAKAAAASARDGIKNTDVTAGVGGRARPADDDEPPF